jgi:hypothetical protein
MRAGFSTSKMFVLSLALALASARADEGMWLFERPPTKLLKDRYGFDRAASS